MTDFESIRDRFEKAWGSLSDGWKHFYQRCKGALTYFESKSLEPSVNSERRLSWGMLNTDLADHHDKLIVTMEVPGMEKDEIQINIEGDLLTIRGTKRFKEQYQEGDYHIMERAYGHFQRSLQLPVKVDKTQADAQYHHGVLRLVLPKVEPAKRIKIEVK